MTDHFDVIILGAGSAGYACALRAADLGLKVALVEKDDLGGTCLHAGCIPTKALLHAADVVETTRKAEIFGITTTGTGADMVAVQKYKDAVVARLFKGLTGLVASRGITVLEGEGRLTASDTVAIADRSYTARNIVIATGSSPRTPPGLAPDGAQVITSDHALLLDRVPRSVVVIGGGVIGCEFASLWSSLGSEVTIVERLPRLLATEDETISKALQRAFNRRRIKSMLSTIVTDVDRRPGSVRVQLDNAEIIDAEIVLGAVGRSPNTSNIGLEELGIQVQSGCVVTDGRLQTTAPGVFAIGDIVAGPQLAHRGFQHGIFVAEHLAGLTPNPLDETGIPRVAYCDPEVASVGLTEAAARELLGADRLETTTYDLAGNGRSLIRGTSGFTKLIREKAGPVLGIHMIGAGASELIGEAQLIYNLRIDPARVASLLHAHPTQTEAIGEAHLALIGKPLHSHA